MIPILLKGFTVEINILYFTFKSNQEECFSCTETLTDTMFGIYTAFVMHTHNMCFYIESTKWQSRVDTTVDRLQEGSSHIASQLEVCGGVFLVL